MVAVRGIPSGMPGFARPGPPGEHRTAATPSRRGDQWQLHFPEELPWLIRHTPNPPSVFAVADGISTEDLLVNLIETLASADALSCDLAFNLDGPKREFWARCTG